MSRFDAAGAALGAEELAGALPAVVLDARRAARTLTAGRHGRRRAGSGDAFWQHRELAAGESVRMVDWRRSARSDRLFVREKERETPALLQIWADLRPSMDWRHDASRPTKAMRAAMLGLALGFAARAGGERVAALGSTRAAGTDAALVEDLLSVGRAPPAAARPGTVLLLTDGLEPAETWAARAGALRGGQAEVLVALIHDPAERTFPFTGRTRFAAPGEGRGSHAETVLIGRAEAARDAYRAVWAAHMAEVAEALRGAGAQVVSHATDEPAGPVALALAAGLEGPGVRGAPTAAAPDGSSADGEGRP